MPGAGTMLGGAPYAAAGGNGRELAVGCGLLGCVGAGTGVGAVLARGDAEALGGGVGSLALGAGSGTGGAGGAAELTSWGAAGGAP